MTVKTKLIVNATRGYALCVGELADNPLLRMRGLLGRTGLPAGEGMLLTPAPSIHTAFMRFPIDAVFLDRELRVIKIVEELGPWRFAAKTRARSVLELPAGESARCGIAVGDVLELRDRVPESSNARTAARRDTPQNEPVADASPGVPDASGGTASRLAPLRVLIASSDRHYRTAMSLLLARRNCLVRSSSTLESIGELVAGERCDVLLLDVGSSRTAAARAALESLSWPVAAVIVADEDGDVPPAKGVLRKWGPFDELMSQIEAGGAEVRGPERNGQP